MRFAHTADVHLGFQKAEALQAVELGAFDFMVDECVRRKVDFLLVAGDLFHVNIPEMRVQKHAFAGFRRLHEAGIPAYAVYGSHDFSPVHNSVIDLLAETGYITKATRAAEAGGDGRVRLEFVRDKKTGAKIAGLPGLKAGRDVDQYERLDREALEAEEGFKIFMFHGGITEMKTGKGPEGDTMPLSLLPRGFDYYAGGHVHRFAHESYGDHPSVVYPGTPFAGYHRDLEESARGQRRGFVVAEAGGGAVKVELVGTGGPGYGLIEADAGNKKSESVSRDLLERAGGADPRGKIMVVRVAGELSSGRTTDIDFAALRGGLMEGGALDVQISRSQLTSREYAITAAAGGSREEIEANVFAENIGEAASEREELTGGRGAALAGRLLRDLARPKLKNENEAGYRGRIVEGSLATMGLGKDDT